MLGVGTNMSTPRSRGKNYSLRIWKLSIVRQPFWGDTVHELPKEGQFGVECSANVIQLFQSAKEIEIPLQATSASQAGSDV